jgi:hypothetical protein
VIKGVLCELPIWDEIEAKILTSSLSVWVDSRGLHTNCLPQRSFRLKEIVVWH